MGGVGVGVGAALPLLPISRPLPSRRNTSKSKPLPPRFVAVNPASPNKGIRRMRGGGFPVFAGGNGDGAGEEEEEPGRGGEAPGSGSGGGGEPGMGKIRWRELLLDRDPENVLAVGLTGLLAWASVQLLWQLLFISLAILLAALKYSFVAALLLFILITLL